MTTSPSLPLRSVRAGFSLLEVLVACGILVVGLASIAAILPAAGSRLGDAAAQDRAVSAAAVAMSEIQVRNLVNRNIFPTGTWTGLTASCPPSPIVFGETLSLAVTVAATSAGYVTTSGSLAITATSGNVTLTNSSTIPAQALLSGTTQVLITPVPSIINSAINNDTTSDDRRGYFLEDELQYDPSPIGDIPLNSFATVISSATSSVRRFNRGICWGAMITPLPLGLTSGSMNAAKVSVAVFKKPGIPTAVTLTSVSGTNPASAAKGVFVTGTTTPVTLQRTSLKPCSMVLAIPPQSSSGTTPPQWLSVRSSWLLTGTMVGPGGTFTGLTGNGLGALVSSGPNTPTCLTFENDVPPGLISSGTPSTMNVICFENLLLVNEQTFPIQ